MEFWLAPPSLWAGEFFTIFGSLLNCHGPRRHDFYYVNDGGHEFYVKEYIWR